MLMTTVLCKEVMIPIPRPLETENNTILAYMYHTCRTKGSAVLSFNF